MDAGEEVIVSLMLDEMAIMKHLSFDGKKYVGGVYLGDGRVGEEEDEMAGDALVFMVVSLNDSWKLPVGYFLINGLGSTGIILFPSNQFV